MKALLSKKYLENFDMKKLSKEIIALFDDYNFLKSLVKAQIVVSFNEKFIDDMNYKHYNDYTMGQMLKKSNYNMFVKEFEKRIEIVKGSFTNDEIMIFTYSIENREADKIVCDRICKSYKTYFTIKKSCYAKLAIQFNLLEYVLNGVNNKAISLINSIKA